MVSRSPALLQQLRCSLVCFVYLVYLVYFVQLLRSSN
jgi:hypothetical protein